jgi:hypothetical protein
MLHCLGIDHTRLIFRFQGRDYGLTDVHGAPWHCWHITNWRRNTLIDNSLCRAFLVMCLICQGSVRRVGFAA